MILEVFSSGPAETNAYLLGCSKTHQAAIIDAPYESAPMLLEAAKSHSLTITTIILTHSHWDHIADVAELKKATNAKVYIHEKDAPNLVKPGADGLRLFIPVEAAKPDGYLVEGEVLKVGDLELKVIHTPGHSPGGVCLYLEKENILFSGDTLFRGTIGRLDLPTGESTEMWRSLKKLAALPPSTRVFPGHGDETAIAREEWIAKAQERFNE